MIFKVNISTEMLKSDDGIDVVLGGLPYPVESVSAENLPFEGILEAPEDSWRLLIQIHFRSSGEIIQTAADIQGAEGLDVRQQGRHFVLAQVRHGAQSSQEQCTVTCLTTGESRSGKGQCIECKLTKGAVKLCC
jgi:hypothetical protein